MGLPLHKLSLTDYLVWENEQAERHEFRRGEVFAVVGARRSHGRVIANLMRHLGNGLSGSPCQAFSESMKLQVGEDTVLYPDVFVTCDRADLATEMIFKSPVVIIEVLSSGTQADDRSRKFALCRRVTSLREYALIDPETRRVEVFRPGSDGLWALHDMSDDAKLVLVSIGCEVGLVELFDGIDNVPASG